MKWYVIKYKNVDSRIKLKQQYHNIQKNLIESQKLEASGIIASGAFHDLNNILSIISGYAQMINICPENSTEYISKIDESCNMMSKIIKHNIQFATSPNLKKNCFKLGTFANACFESMCFLCNLLF